MSVPFELRVDLASGAPVITLADLALGSVPQFVEGVNIDFKVWAVQKIGGLASYVPTTGITVSMYLGKLTTNPPQYYTQQVTWTASSDPSDPYFAATLPMNVAFGFSPSVSQGRFITADFGVFFFSGGNPIGALQRSVRVFKSLYSTSSLVVPIGQTALSVEVANSLYLQRNIPCSSQNPVVFQNTNTGKLGKLYVDDDGTTHFDPIT